MLDTVPRASSLSHHASVAGSNGAFVRGRGVRSAQKTGLGNYQVVFDRDVRNCNFLATLAGDEPGEILARPNPSNPNAVVVQTFESVGAPVLITLEDLLAPHGQLRPGLPPSHDERRQALPAGTARRPRGASG